MLVNVIQYDPVKVQTVIFMYNKFLHVIHDHWEYREIKDAGINCNHVQLRVEIELFSTL